jgi:hypothetical protein
VASHAAPAHSPGGGDGGKNQHSHAGNQTRGDQGFASNVHFRDPLLRLTLFLMVCGLDGLSVRPGDSDGAETRRAPDPVTAVKRKVVAEVRQDPHESVTEVGKRPF